MPRAVAEGERMRVRRGWIALPDADASLVDAARTGVVLTCLTQAHRLGLWVLAESKSHVGVPAHAGLVRLPGRHLHWAEPVVPRHPDALVDPIENVLALVAAYQPREAALAVWESALQKGLVSIDGRRRLNLGPAGRALCGPQRDSDIAHDAELMLIGLLRGAGRVRSAVERWHEVQELIMRAVAQGLHRAA